MKKVIHPSPVDGTIKAPPSKSHAQRAIIAAALTSGLSEIVNPGNSDDVISCLNLARDFGAMVDEVKNKLFIKGSFRFPENTLRAGESGLSFRIFSCLAALSGSEIRITGEKSLRNRPVFSLQKTMQSLGVDISSSGGFPPVVIKGPLKNGVFEIDGSEGSQIISGLLFAFPLVTGEPRLLVDNLKSTPYVDLTMEVLGNCGISILNRQYYEFHISGKQQYSPALHNIEGDWSGASFMLVAGAIGGKISLVNLKPESSQADRKILHALDLAGASVQIEKTRIVVKKNKLRAFEFHATDCPDLFPPLVALASHCKGKTTITGANRLVTKESNRAITLQEEFGKMGIKIEIFGNSMLVEGAPVLSAKVHSHSDHRIAMACAVAALAGSGPVEIENSETVHKSYPGFFEDLNSITLYKYSS